MTSRKQGRVTLPAPRQVTPCILPKIVVKTSSTPPGGQTLPLAKATPLLQNARLASLTVPAQPTVPAKRKAPADSDEMKKSNVFVKTNKQAAKTQPGGNSAQKAEVKANDEVRLSKRHRSRQILSSDSDFTSNDQTDHPRADNGKRHPPRPLTPSTTPGPASVDTLQGIKRCLTAIPTGEIAYGAELADMPDPRIEIVDTGTIKFPFDEDQRSLVKNFAKELRESRFGIDWNRVGKIPTWVIPGSGIEIGEDPEWKARFDDIVAKAAEHLGFGDAKLTTMLHALYLWEKGSMWRDYNNKYYDPLRVGTLLIILNKDYKGGEIGVACGDKEVLFDPAAAKGRHFWVASHNRVEFDNLQLTEGYRLGLSYDLRLKGHDGKSRIHQLLEETRDRETELRDYLTNWALEVEAGDRDNHPLYYVLSKNYRGSDMSLDRLIAPDRAKALALQSSQREEYGQQHRLKVYLVAVSCAVTTSGRSGSSGVVEEPEVSYSILRAASLDGRWARSISSNGTLGKRCVLQREECENGPGTSTRVGNVTRVYRFRTCLVLVFEKTAEGD